MTDQIHIDNAPTDAISAANALLAAKKQAKADKRRAQRAAAKGQSSPDDAAPQIDQPSPAPTSPAPAKPLTDAQKCRDILVSNMGKSIEELKALVAPLGVKDSTLTTLRSDVAATMAAARRCGLLIDQGA